MEEKISKELQEKLMEIYDSLTDEQKEKAKKCETVDEILDLAGEEGIELPEELLKSAAGGGASYITGLPSLTSSKSNLKCR